MSIVSAAVFKTQVAAMATALTTAWKDSVATEVAASIRNPLHGLRQVDKFFSFNPATGVVTSDDGYIDSVYAGDTPNKGSQLDITTTVAMALTTATVEDAAPSNIVLTFAENIIEASNISVGGEANTVGVVSIAGAVVTITVGTPYVNGNVINVTGTFSGQKLNSIALAAESVTNNVA